MSASCSSLLAFRRTPETEMYSIINGEYQKENSAATYELSRSAEYALRSRAILKKLSHLPVAFVIYPLIDQEGLKATAAIVRKSVEPVVEVAVNFFGTIDFASQVADMEKGGPGQETLKQHELLLLSQLNELLTFLKSSIYPDKKFLLRLSGHSLGGALAKGCCLSVLKTLALLQQSPEMVLSDIRGKLAECLPEEIFSDLNNELSRQAEELTKLTSFNDVSGITLYAHGAPGISKDTDVRASLLSWFMPEDFVRAYHCHHIEDIIPKFGESELFSGLHGVIPNILINKVITYSLEVTPEQISAAQPLPFPGLDKRMMALHSELLYREETQPEKPQNIRVMEVRESDHLLDKYTFHPVTRGIYKLGFFCMRSVAATPLKHLFPLLQSRELLPIPKPEQAFLFEGSYKSSGK